MWNFSGQYFPVFGLNRETRSISPYSVRMRENTSQKNSGYGYFLRSVNLTNIFKLSTETLEYCQTMVESIFDDGEKNH